MILSENAINIDDEDEQLVIFGLIIFGNLFQFCYSVLNILSSKLELESYSHSVSIIFTPVQRAKYTNKLCFCFC